MHPMNLNLALVAVPRPERHIFDNVAPPFKAAFFFGHGRSYALLHLRVNSPSHTAQLSGRAPAKM